MRRYIFRKYTRSSYIKVIGSRSRSRGQKMHTLGGDLRWWRDILVLYYLRYYYDNWSVVWCLYFVFYGQWDSFDLYRISVEYRRWFLEYFRTANMCACYNNVATVIVHWTQELAIRCRVSFYAARVAYLLATVTVRPALNYFMPILFVQNMRLV